MIHVYHLEKFALMREAVKKLSSLDPVQERSGQSPDSVVFEHHPTASGVNVPLLDMALVTKMYQPLTDCLDLGSCRSK